MKLLRFSLLIILSIILLTAVVSAQSIPPVPLEYPDVPANHWAYEGVEKASFSGNVEGDEKGYFRGNQSLTRYEFAVAFSRLLSNPSFCYAPGSQPRFRWKSLDELEQDRLFPPTHSPDVPRDHYAYEAAQLVQRFGIMRGNPKGLFAGSKPMTRYEFVTALMRFQKILDASRVLVPGTSPPTK
jgi:hypothetical protein